MKVFLLIFLSCLLSSCGEDSKKALIEDVLEKSPQNKRKSPSPPSEEKEGYADVHETWLLHFGANTPLLDHDNSSNEFCSAITVDIQDNIYCAGTTRGDLIEANAGETDIFVMKLNSKREIQWITQLGAETTGGGDNAGFDVPTSIEVDLIGNVYCAGSTNGDLGENRGDVDVAEDEIPTTDAFVLKLNPEGELLWVTQLGADTVVPGGVTGGNDYCNGVDVDLEGNVYCAGHTEGSLGEANLEADLDEQIDDAFVMKLNTDGEIQWITQLGAATAAPGGDNSDGDICNDVAVDYLGNVYCGGYTYGAMGEANGGSDDAFVMKLNTDGELQWLTQLGANTMAPGGDNSLQDSCDKIEIQIIDNAVYCAGSTGGSIGEENADTNGSNDAFVLRLNTDGEIQWITQLGHVTRLTDQNNSATESLYDMTLAAWGDILITGNTESSMAETKSGYYDPFIARISKAGDLKWITQLGQRTVVPGGNNRGNDNCNGIAVDRFDNIYCSGWAIGDIGEPHGGGGNDIFFLKLNPEGKFND